MKNLRSISYSAEFDTRDEANAFVAEATREIAERGMSVSNMSIYARAKYPKYDKNNPEKSNTPIGKVYAVGISGSIEKDDFSELY